MTDSKEDGLTISVEREDLEDGSITYHLWDTTNGDYKWIVGLNDDKAAQGGKSKFYAERIALAVNALSTPPKPVAGSKEDGLRFADLRRANVERQEHWGGSENWTLADWSNAVAGEVGEACNVVKKIRRPQLGTVGNDADAPKYYAQLESEIGDVLIYLDLLAKAAGFTLDTCVSRAFNEKSEKLGMPVRLSASSPPVGGSGEVVAWRWRAKAKGVWGLWSVVDVDPNDWTWRDYWEDLDIIPLYAAPVPKLGLNRAFENWQSGNKVPLDKRLKGSSMEPGISRDESRERFVTKTSEAAVNLSAALSTLAATPKATP